MSRGANFASKTNDSTYFMYIFPVLFITLILVLFVTTGFAQRQINVPSDVPSQLLDSLAVAQAGDVLNLIDEGPYGIDSTFVNTVPLTIQADPSLTAQDIKPKIVLLVDDTNMIKPAEDLTLIGLELVGLNPDNGAQASRFIRIDISGVADRDITVRNCEFSGSGSGLLRVQEPVGTIIFDDVIAHDMDGRPMDVRGVDVDTLKVMNSTFYNIEDKFRLRGVIGMALFDAVTVTNTFAGEGIEFADVVQPNATIRNTLIVNSLEETIDINEGSNVTIEFTCIYQDPDSVAAGVYHAGLDSLEQTFFDAGTGNVVADPVFEDPDNGDFSVSIFATAVAFGNSEGEQIGDRRWGTYIPTAVEELPDNVPNEFALFQNFPNPFNPSTVIRYELQQASDVRLTIYNVLGQEVIRLVNRHQNPGMHNVKWQGRDSRGITVNSGVYFYKLETDGLVQTRKMIFMQ